MPDLVPRATPRATPRTLAPLAIAAVAVPAALYWLRSRADQGALDARTRARLAGGRG